MLKISGAFGAKFEPDVVPTSSTFWTSGEIGSGSGSEPGRVRAPHNSCDQPPAPTFRDGSCDPIP